MADDEQHASNRVVRPELTRRGVLSGAAILGIGAGLDHAIASSPHKTTAKPPGPGVSETAVPFYGDHQAGVATPTQEWLCFAVFDLTSVAADDLRGVLEQWTTAAARLTAGESYQPAAQTK
jgi:deferrochelatase/peroxidase EfeB